MIHSSFSYSPGCVGETGSVGSQGPPGPQAEKGKGLSGVKYVRWGRTNCSGNASTVYSGKGGYLFIHLINCVKMYVICIEEIILRITYFHSFDQNYMT